MKKLGSNGHAVKEGTASQCLLGVGTIFHSRPCRQTSHSDLADTLDSEIWMDDPDRINPVLDILTFKNNRPESL